MKPSHQDKSTIHKNATALYSVLSKLSTPENIRIFLEDLATPAELQSMADRWRVVHLLKEAKSYREINELTGVSVTTVGRVARVLEFGQGGYQLGLDKA